MVQFLGQTLFVLTLQRRVDKILLSTDATLYFVAVDAGGDAMEDGTWNEAVAGAKAGAFFMNFFSGT